MLMRYWPKILKYLHGNNTIKEQKKDYKSYSIGWILLEITLCSVLLCEFTNIKKAFKKSDSLAYSDIYL